MRIVMMGTGTFAEPTFAALLGSGHEVLGLVTQPDRAVGKERGSSRLAKQGMKELAVARSVPVLQPESINTPEGVAALKSLRPELLVVAAYGQILSREVLAIPPLGGINVHASLLPKYRGAAPINWAIWQGETHSGVTIIRMSVALDAGEMLAQEAVAIRPDETAGELEARLGPLGATMAVDIVNRLSQGPVAGVKQDKALATKAPKLTKEMGLIDWTRSAAAVDRQIRALHPWPTPYTMLRRPDQPSLRLIVHKATAVALDLASNATPGALHHDKAAQRLFVRTGDAGWIEILDVQPAGKRRMNAADFLRGNPLGDQAALGDDQPASA